MDTLTPEQEQKVSDFLNLYDSDWGLYAGMLMERRSISREAAILTLLAMQTSQLAAAIEKQTHPEVRDDCIHCQRAQKAMALQERAIELMEQSEHDEREWGQP